ncbi:hypothetical protein PROFUN_11779 [Planoprotostelium fungivorum]|uniref:U4/U6.U5 small nuclear ribonucleoprotein 27kDa protein domain-containing protein n=1 Tax=Planoprotostelium fungivorum TaxID=1890364 RepID=A0A2P6N8N9_9EUKA|nr:hypothetical protein PROFUN_11779 [Planoprotostelium fungivorum]
MYTEEEITTHEVAERGIAPVTLLWRMKARGEIETIEETVVETPEEIDTNAMEGGTVTETRGGIEIVEMIAVTDRGTIEETEIETVAETTGETTEETTEGTEIETIEGMEGTGGTEMIEETETTVMTEETETVTIETIEMIAMTEEKERSAGREKTEKIGRTEEEAEAQKKRKKEEKEEEKEEELDPNSEEYMMKQMGLTTGFGSTKGKHVESNEIGTEGARVNSARVYRQYMNRRGGFNRPLDNEPKKRKV